jgi:hypothetical protein
MGEEAKKSMEKGVPDPYACGNSAFQEMGEYRKKMRVIVCHGIWDTTVHPINGQQVITQWAQTNFLVEGGIGLADVTPSLVKSDIINGKSYTQHLYNDGDGEPLLELWMIDKMGHTWSGGSPHGSYSDPSGPNITEIIWNFFSKYQHQPEEERIETPANTHVQLPVNELVPSPDNQPVQTPTESVEELPTESAEELPIESPEELPTEPPKKNFISLLLSKLRKKKK